MIPPHSHPHGCPLPVELDCTRQLIQMPIILVNDRRSRRQVATRAIKSPHPMYMHLQFEPVPTAWFTRRLTSISRMDDFKQLPIMRKLFTKKKKHQQDVQIAEILVHIPIQNGLLQ
eukprot:TCALIF_06120-PA protein Name:"Protein of unknown function" AED:0.78 eAED:0.78 QI:0/0/0.25/0.25/1/1/4/0/115